MAEQKSNEKEKKNKYTENFEKTIKDYLENRAKTDKLFAKRYKLPEKNIEDCIQYIFNTVQDSGAYGFTDEEVFSMAVHYYDEDIDPKKFKQMRDHKIIVNHQVQLTEEEKKEAREKAKEKLMHDELNKLRASKKKKSHTSSSTSKEPKKGEQQSLI